MECRLAKYAQEFRDSQPEDARLRLDSDIQRVVSSPFLSPDDTSKVPFQRPPAVFTLWRGEEHWVVYRVSSDGGELVIYNIGRADETPDIRRV